MMGPYFGKKKKSNDPFPTANADNVPGQGIGHALAAASKLSAVTL